MSHVFFVSDCYLYDSMGGVTKWCGPLLIANAWRRWVFYFSLFNSYIVQLEVTIPTHMPSRGCYCCETKISTLSVLCVQHWRESISRQHYTLDFLVLACIIVYLLNIC